MAKKALVNKANKKPKFKVRGVHPLQQVRSPARGLPQVRALPHLPARDGARRRAARCAEVQLVTAKDQHDQGKCAVGLPKKLGTVGTAARKVKPLS